MEVNRPDLSQADDAIVAYIEALETQLMALQTSKRRKSAEPRSSSQVDPSEAETTINVITVTSDDLVKRTPRHLYLRQRRSGMGNFDMQTDESRPVTKLCVADENEDILVITDHGRIFRIPVASLPQSDLRGKGEMLTKFLDAGSMDDESIIALLRADDGLYVNLISQRGWLRHVRKSYLGPTMTQGIRYHKISDGGYLVDACWSDGNQDIFIASRGGLGIRFSEKQVPSTGCLGMRVTPDDPVIAMTATDGDGGVFVMGADGKGTIRLMEGFRQNKAPGAGGKVILKTDRLVDAHAVDEGNDVFAISRTSKMIRFSADEVPAKTGVVQGVNCMALRKDEVMAFVVDKLQTVDEA